MEEIYTILIAFLFAFFFLFLILFFNRKSRVDESQSSAIRDLERRITDLMTNQLKEIRGSVDGTSKAMNEQISSFTKETIQIKEELKQVQARMQDISSFQEFFKSPKLRGQWGEANLEHILSEYFPPEFYAKQYLFSSGEQVDAVLKLPDKKLLPIDSKFPLDNFRKMVESERKEEKEFYRKKFIEDTKKRIQEISSKYILPSENTVDFALMYIPAEAIYYEINVNRNVDLGDYARSKKVVLTSPNTIYLTLKTIENWFRDTQISKQTQEILKKLNRVQQDAVKLVDDFRKLGGHLKNAVSSYDSSEKRVSLFKDRVSKLLEVKGIKKLKDK